MKRCLPVTLFLLLPLALNSGAVAQELPSAAPQATLFVHAVRGEAGGPPVTEGQVEIDFVQNGAVQKTLTLELDNSGLALVTDFEIELGFQPVVRITYDGVVYQQIGGILSDENPVLDVEVICYDVTDEAPAWNVTMRHVMLSQTTGGLRVTEVLMIANPDAQTWRGAPDASGRTATLHVEWPETATDYKLGNGFHDWCCTSLDHGSLVNHLPLMPGETELNYSFVVPSTDGEVTLDLIAPALVDNMMVIVPANLTMRPAPDLQWGGVRQIADTQVNYYTSADLAAGRTVSLILSGLTRYTAEPTIATAGEVDTSSMAMAKKIAGIGVGILVLAAVGLVLVRTASRKTAGGEA